MIIQIFGKKNCNDTKKAQRFFKERNIAVQFIDLNEKGISKGELKDILKHFTLEELLDVDGKEYTKRNLKYFQYEIGTLLEESPELYKTPILRSKQGITLAYHPEIWSTWNK